MTKDVPRLNNHSYSVMRWAYINESFDVIICDETRHDLEKKSFYKERWQLKKERVGDCVVSTVFTGVDTNTNEDGMWFQTVVFGCRQCFREYTYNSYSEALKGHSNVAEHIRSIGACAFSECSNPSPTHIKRLSHWIDG